MLRKTLRLVGWLGAGILILVLAAFVALSYSEALQDRLVAVGVQNNVAAGLVDDWGGDNLEVAFCGTASPMGNGPRAQQCVAVFAGDKFFIVDAGARSAARANEIGLPMGRLSGVLLTHFHSDHISALGEMHLASWVRGRPSKLDVYGGPGINQVVDGFNMAYGLDYGYRVAHHGMAVLPPAHAGLRARAIDAPETGSVTIYEEDGLKISAFTVPHPPITPAYGYRFDYRGRSVVISGDTKKSNRLAAAAQNADVLIHEVLQPQLVKAITDALDAAEIDALSKLLTDTLDYHTTPVEAAEIANAANVDTLVFNHFAPPPANAIAARIFMRGVKDVRPQGAVMSDDGMRITLPPKTGDAPGIIEISGN